jgi:hypothetical protein
LQVYFKWLVALLQRANQDDRRAIAALHIAFAAQPSLWDQVGDAALQAQASLLALAAGPNEAARDAIRRKLQQLKRELLGENA